MRTVDQEGADRSGRLPVPEERWLIAKAADGALEPFLIDGGETLPVFSFEEEARIFLWLAGLGERWITRPSGCGELVSVLYGPCARVRSVALDPLPGMVGDGTIGLVSLDRNRFIDYLMGGKSG